MKDIYKMCQKKDESNALGFNAQVKLNALAHTKVLDDNTKLKPTKDPHFTIDS